MGAERGSAPGGRAAHFKHADQSRVWLVAERRCLPNHRPRKQILELSVCSDPLSASCGLARPTLPVAVSLIYE